MSRYIIFTIFTILLILSVSIPATSTQFTEEDRARLIRLEATLKTFMDQTNKRFEDINKRFEDINRRFGDMNKRFEDINKRFEQLMDFLYILSAIFTTMTVSVIGFAYWDRRTIIKKSKEETIEEIEKYGKVKDIVGALRLLAAQDEKIANTLRSFNLF